MCFVAVLWVFFRAETCGDSLTILRTIVSDFSLGQAPAFFAARMLWLVLMLAIIIPHILPAYYSDKALRWFVNSRWLVKLLIFIVVVQLVLELQSESVVPFIYFRF